LLLVAETCRFTGHYVGDHGWTDPRVSPLLATDEVQRLTGRHVLHDSFQFQPERNLAIAEPDHLDHPGQVDPRDRVVDREGQRHDVEQHPPRRPEGGQERGVRVGSLPDPMELDEQDDQECRDEDAGDLPDHEEEVVGPAEPPRRGQLRIVEPGSLDPRRRHERPPHGMSMDMTQSFAPATFERWMAAVGYTPLGPTTKQ